MAEDVEEEIYSGFGMISDESDLDVSRLITEEDLIDSLFFICDADQTGCIPVSRIIDFLKCTTNVTEAGQSDLNELVALLDPERKDIMVNLDTCRKQISEWIEKIKPQSELADLETKCSKSQKSNALIGIDEAGDHALNNGRHKHEAGEIQRLSEQEIADLNLKIDTLHHQNKKLSEENGNLKAQLEVIEETASYQSQRLEEITKRMRSLQQVVDRREETLSENVDLKATIAVLEEEKGELFDHVKEMEKANSGLENQVNVLERKMEKAKSDVQIAEKQQIDLQTTLFKQKHLWARSEEERDAIESHLNEKSKKFEELQTKFDTIKKASNELTDQKVELELQLSETQQQLASVRMKAEKFGVPECSSSEDEMEAVYIVPSAASTPKNKKAPIKSLGMELRKMLDDDKHLPSPLCEREWEDSVFLRSAEKDHVNNNKTDFSNELARILDSTTSNDDINGVSSTVASEIMQRQEMVIRRMSELVDAADKEEREHLCSSPTTFKVKLREDFEFFTKKITALTSAKRSAEDRVSRMMTTLQRLKDENARLRQIHEDSLQQMLDCSSGFQATLDGRLLIIKEQLDEKKRIIRSMEEKLSCVKIELKGAGTENIQLLSKVEELQSNKKNLEVEVKRLKQNNLEVVEKFHRSELKALELKEEVQNSLDILSREKHRCKYLEDDLAQSKHHHQVDLEEIWRAVQKAVEKDHRVEQKSFRSDALKDQVAKEIETLKSQLYKTQAAFTALKTKTNQLPAPVGKCELRIAHSKHEDQGPSSPLVDALTIEFFDGSQLTRRNSRKSHTFATVEEALYAQSNLSAPVCSRDLAVSCPSLASQSDLVTSGTQTEDVTGNSSRDTNLNTSNSSSTSGVLDLDLSSSSLRSLVGRNRRTNFLRNFQRFDSDSQTSQSLESNTDTDVSLPRQRSPSFLAAIEGHGQMVTSQCDGEDTIKQLNQGFTPAIEATENGPLCKGSRRSSFRAAIESGQRTPTEAPCDTDFMPTSPDTTPENPNFPDYVLKQWGDSNVQRPGDHRMVSFELSSYTSSEHKIRQPDGYLPELDRNPSNVCANSNSAYQLYDPGSLDSRSGYSNGQSNMDYSGKYNNVASQQTDDRRLSSPKQTARKLSTLVEEDFGDVEKDRLPCPGTDRLDNRPGTTTTLESSFHDNDKVVTTFKVSADVHHQHPPLSHHISARPHSPPRYSSLLAAKVTDHQQQPANRRCSNVDINNSTEENDIVPTPYSPRRPPCAAHFAVPAFSNTHEESAKTNCGARSPLLSEKSSLIAKANRDKNQTSPTQIHHGAISSPKISVDRTGTVKETKPTSSQEKRGARKNLAKLIIEHDAATTQSSSGSSLGKQYTEGEDSPAKMDRLTDRSSRGCLSSELSLKSKNPPLTRHSSIHEEDGHEGKVSFHRSPESKKSKSSEPFRGAREAVGKDVQTNRPATGQADHCASEDKQAILSRLSKVTSPTALSKIREEHLARKRDQVKHMKMPELSELSEMNGAAHKDHPATSLSPAYSGRLSSSSSDTGLNVLSPPGPTKNPAYPSLPDEFLKSLGLLQENASESPEQLTDQEIEAKFASLALAFKTDKLTLEKRLEIQERSRDVAEQNIEKELHGIKDSVATLSQLCSDSQTRDVIAKLQHHLEVLEQSVVRVSSRAEVYGAVQQESRMSKAIEVMIQHVESLKLVHEKEHTELEEARKFLQDNKVYNSLQGSDAGHFDAMCLSKRSLSLAGNATVKGARRRNSVSVLPKMLGGAGTPFSLSQSTSSLESFQSVDRFSPTRQLSISLDEDPKSRFQSAVASTTVKSAVAGVLRRASLEKTLSNPNLNLSKQSVIQENTSDKSLNSGAAQKPEAKDERDKSKKEEEAFQRGFEQGVRAHLGREMSQLREQQQAFCDTLENLMDENEISPEDANGDKETVMNRLRQFRPEWEKSGKKIRFTLAGFVCLMALCSIVFTLFPFGAATVTGSLRHHGQPPL